MNTERSEMFGSMNVKKLLIKLAVPATLAMIFNALYNLVDTIFIAWGAGEIAIGALSIAYPIQMIVLALGAGIGVGSSSVFSRAYGRGDEKTMRRVVNTALMMNFLLAAFVSIATFIFLDPILNLFGASPSNYAYAKSYLQIILIALIPFSLSITLNNLTRAEGRPKIAMKALIIGAVINIILDPLFIFDFGLGLGVAGAAYATAIAKSAQFVYIMVKGLSKDSSLIIDLKTIYKVDLKIFKEVVAVGIPTFVRQSLGALLIIVVNNLINNYAPADPAIYISIYGVINRLIRFTLMPGFGLVQGLVPIVGFNFGAQFFKRLHDVIAYASKLLLIYFASTTVLVLLFAEYFFMIFSPESDPFFIAEGAKAFRMVSLGFGFITFQVILSGVYQAMGYPIRAFFVALSRRFILYIPIAFLLSWLIGIDGIWLTFFLADTIAGLLSFVVYYFEMKELKTKIVEKGV